MIQDHSPIVVNQFGGLYGIDSYNDSVPIDHFIDSLNTITFGDEVKTRDGFASSFTFGAIVRFHIYRRQGEAARVLALDNAGNLYDLTVSAVTPILTVAGMSDFAVGFQNNRAFISPNNGITGIVGSFVYVYSGSGTPRKAAGAAPIGSFTVVNSATAGTVEAGTHIFAWVYETDTGFVTAPSPAQTIEADGTKAVDFSNVPTGPTGTAKRRLIASKAIQDYNGNELGYEMFFVPNGTISDNVTTVLAAVDFFDVDLLESADYTYNQLDEIPAVLFISSYGQRMVYGNTDADRNIVYFSKQQEPESISSTGGFISYDPFETGGVADGVEFRDNFYTTKDDHTYTIRDNGAEPSTWGSPVRLDHSIGAGVNGIAEYKDSSKGARSSFFIVGNKSGLYKFDGVYQDIPLNYKVRKIWDRINRNYINKMQILIDQTRFLIYVLVPLDGVSSPNYILVGDFERGFEADRIKWHLWSFAEFSPSCMGIDIDATTKKTTLKVATLSGNIYAQEDDRKNDAGVAINNFIQFALLGETANAIHHYGGIGLRIKGVGTLGVRLYGEDNIDTQILPNLVLAATPGKEYIRLANFQSEKASLKISLNEANGYFKLDKMGLYANVVFYSRPG